MKRKQLAAIMLSAIMAVSACVPVNGISAAAAENTGAESTETSTAAEALNEAVESVTEAEDSNEQGEAEEALEAPAAQEMADAPDMQGESAENAATTVAPAEEEAAPTAEDPAEEPEEDNAADATEEEPATVDAAVEEEPAPAKAVAGATAEKPTNEAATAKDRPDQVVEEETREEAGRPALRALQPDDFEDAEEIYSGDKKNEEAFRNNGYAVWKFTPDESGSYRFEVQTDELTYIVFYDADYNEIAYDGGYWLGIERYFREGVTYYLAAGLCVPDLAEDPDLYALICLDRLDMPDFYVEGEYEFQIRVPYGKEAVLSLYAQSSTGEIYYKWTDESGKIVGTSDSYTFTPESNTAIYCTVSDGPDEETAHSEVRRFAVNIENHLTVEADGEYEIGYGYMIKSVDFGDPVTLKVTASADDDSGLTYRWERKEVSMVEDEDGELVSWTKYVTIEGEETDTYEIESAEESGRYCCTVTDRFGNGRSQYFDLRVANLVSAYPEGAKKGDDTVSLHAESGSALTLRVIVNAADTSKVTFEWYRVEKEDDDSWSDWNLIPGADTAEYEIKSVKDGERYYCYVSDGNKEFDLDFYVSVENPPSAENPLSVKAEGAKENESNNARLYADAGSSLTLRAVVSAPEDSQLKYTWSSAVLEFEEDEWEDVSWYFTTIKGANKAEYRIAHAEESVYKCTVSDQHGNSAEALFYVCTENRLHAYTMDGDEEVSALYLRAKPSDSTTLRVIATAIDDSGITYQWQKVVHSGEEEPVGDDYDDEYDDEDYTDIEGATEDSYQPDITDSFEYRCVVRDRHENFEYVYFHISVDNELNAYPEGAEEGSDTVDIYSGLGDTVVLKVNAEAFDDSKLTYEWLDEDREQIDAERDELVIENVTQSQRYVCDVSDQYGNWSRAIFNIVIENHLRVYPEGNENTDTLDIEVLPLASVTLKVVAEADDMSGLTFQWNKDYEPIEGADTDTYAITPADRKEIEYSCEVRDRYNTRKTITFNIHVDNRFSAYPEGAEEGQTGVDVYVGYGKSVTLRPIVSAVNKDRLEYSWGNYYYDLEGDTTGSEYTVSSVTEPVNIYLFVYDGFGTQRFMLFKLHIDNHLRVYPEGYEGHEETTIYAKPGSEVTLGAVVEADARENLHISWYKDLGDDSIDLTDDYVNIDDHVSEVIVDAEDAVYVCEAWDKYGNSKQARFIVKLSDEIPIVDISEAAVTVSDAIYNGTAQRPAVRVAYMGRVLKKRTDYKVSYENNVNAGIKTAKAVITGNNIALSGEKEVAFSVLPGKTTRGDMFNLAGNVKVTWKAVPGAKYYKVYREGVTNAAESVSEPVIVTSRLVGWDKAPGLVNGHAYRYKIVASLTGKGGAGDAGGLRGGVAGGSGSGSAGNGSGDAGSEASGDLSGDSPLSYSKLMYRLKTVAIKRVRNTEPGKAKVWFNKTTSGDSYVLRYSEREDMVGAKTKVVKGAENTSYTIGGLKKGKTYYISIRVRKKVRGINYYTTFGVAKKIKIEK